MAKQATKVLKMMEQAPLPQIIENLARGLAEAQYNLDRFVIQSLSVLANTSGEHGITVPDSDGKPVEKSMLELGLLPSFYHLTEMHFNVRMALSSMEGEEFGIGASISGGKPGIFGASLSASYSNKYSFSADAASEISTTIVSVPPPTILTDMIARLNAAKK
jgi:hypothetical protein